MYPTINAKYSYILQELPHGRMAWPSILNKDPSEIRNIMRHFTQEWMFPMLSFFRSHITVIKLKPCQVPKAFNHYITRTNGEKANVLEV